MACALKWPDGLHWILLKRVPMAREAVCMQSIFSLREPSSMGKHVTVSVTNPASAEDSSFTSSPQSLHTLSQGSLCELLLLCSLKIQWSYGGTGVREGYETEQGGVWSRKIMQIKAEGPKHAEMAAWLVAVIPGFACGTYPIPSVAKCTLKEGLAVQGKE